MSGTDDKDSTPQASQQTSKRQQPVAQPAASMSADQAANEMRKLGANLTTYIREAARTDLSDFVVECEQSVQPPIAKPAEKPTEEK